MPYIQPGISIDDLRARLDYDPAEGTLRWRVSSRNVYAGTNAGGLKPTRVGRDGEKVYYHYVHYQGRDIPTSRIVWALHYGEWSAARLLYVDGDPQNLRIANLKKANSLTKSFDKSEGQGAYMKAHREAYPKAWRETHLRRHFGIGLADYAVLIAAQDNKCAICNEEETEMRGGKVKALAVDHNHETDEVRGLLCVACNTGLGKFGDDRERLLAAIKYLDKHSGREAAKPDLTVVKGSPE